MSDWRKERDLARKTIDPMSFLDNPNFLVRDGLLLNPNVTEEILKKLSHDPSINVNI